MQVHVSALPDGQFEVCGSVDDEVQIYFWTGFCLFNKDEFEVKNEGILSFVAKDEKALFRLLAVLADLGKATPSKTSCVEFFGEAGTCVNPPEGIFDLPTLEPRLQIPLERFKFELKQECDRVSGREDRNAIEP